MSDLPAQIAAIRAFNRFYTKVIGLLDEGIMKSEFSLAEARVLHEIGKLDRTSSTALAKSLGMDPGQLSRLIARLSDKDMLTVAPSPGDGRVNDLHLTGKGSTAFTELNRLSDSAAEALLAPLSPSERGALTAAMGVIAGLIGDGGTAEITLRHTYGTGELGWLIHRQAIIYNQEHGWDAGFEALIARIYAEFEEASGTPPKRLWIAELNGTIAGSIFVLPAANEPGVAQLRMLYAEPFARGHGLGNRLVGETVAFARNAGYQRIMLWTQDCLTSARKVYMANGFQLRREERHFSFGKHLNGQFWERALDD